MGMSMMLKIQFYNQNQKYVQELEPFANKDVRRKIKQASQYAAVHPEIAGWTVSEFLCGTWCPYRPFNGTFRYCFNSDK